MEKLKEYSIMNHPDYKALLMPLKKGSSSSCYKRYSQQIIIYTGVGVHRRGRNTF